MLMALQGVSAVPSIASRGRRHPQPDPAPHSELTSSSASTQHRQLRYLTEHPRQYTSVMIRYVRRLAPAATGSCRAMFSYVKPAMNGSQQCRAMRPDVIALQHIAHLSSSSSSLRIGRGFTRSWVMQQVAYSAGSSSIGTSHRPSGRVTRCHCTTGARDSGEPTSPMSGAMSSEAAAIDESAIDSIPDSHLPAGATRTKGPGDQQDANPEAGPSSIPTGEQPEVDIPTGNPKPEAQVPPSGKPTMDAEEPTTGKPRTAGPEVSGDPLKPSDQPEIQSANPDRVPFWGS